MKKYIKLIILLLVIFGSYLFPCTGFVVRSGDRVLIGNNEDYFTGYTDSNLEILPATSTTYGCLTVGFNQQNFAMGGMNDQGLFCDWFSVPRNGWHQKSDRETFPNGFKPCYILQYCSSIDEAIAYFYKYNLSIFDGNRVMLADKYGNAAVVEWGKEDLEVIWMKNNYMVATNFLLNDPAKGGYPCPRFNTATEMLNSEKPSLDLCRRIVDSAHVEHFEYQTKYSNVYELQKGDIYLYNYHNFQEYIKINLFEELENRNSYKNYILPDYFSEINILTPVQNELVDPENARFSFKGKKNSTYSLVYSRNSDFSDSISHDVYNQQLVYYQSNYIFYFGSLVFLGGIARKRRLILIFIIMLLFGLFSWNCNINDSEENNQSESQLVFSKTISSLDTDTTYYWKILAKQKEGLISESIVNSFKTKN